MWLYEIAGCILFLVITLLLILLLNPLWIMNLVARSNKVSCYKDLAYGLDLSGKPEQEKAKSINTRHTLDLYIPNVKCLEPSHEKPVIVFVHGGAWDSGHKDDYQFAAMEFAKLGFITAVPNYRLYPEAKFPNFIEDVASAIGSLPHHVNTIEPLAKSSNKKLEVILIGHSAGAHTIAMLNSDKQYLAKFSDGIHIKACIGMAGPYDLPLDDPLVVGKFDGIELHDVCDQYLDKGHEHNQHDANPINFAHKNMAPMLLMHGKADDTVGLYHTERFSKRLTELSVPHETIIYDKVPHKHMVAGLSLMFHGFNDVFKDIRSYLLKLS